MLNVLSSTPAPAGLKISRSTFLRLGEMHTDLACDPPPKMDVLGREPEVVVRGKEHELVASGQLNKQGINRSELHAAAATYVAHFRRFNVIVAIRLQKAEG